MATFPAIFRILFALPRASNGDGGGVGRGRSETDRLDVHRPAREVAAHGFARIHWPDEADVVQRLRMGDHAAFDRIFLAYYAPLAEYASMFVRDDALAEDVAQSVMVRLWDGRSALTVRGALGAYLFSATRNAALNAVRDRTRRQTRQTGWEQDAHADAQASVLPDHPGDTDDPLSRIEALVERVLTTLPPRCRETFTLRWRQGLRYTEIAALMGVSVKTVETQLTIAVKAIRGAAELESHGDQEG